jgi:DNA-3-methyladenine glycosylase II
MARSNSPSKVTRLAAAGKDTGVRKRPATPRRTVARPVPACPVAAIRNEADLASAFALLCEVDAELVARLAEDAGPPPLRLRAPGFAGLAWIVVSQQVSTASANAIYGRLQGHLPSLDAASLAASSDDDLRGCGLSTPKLRTLRILAEAVLDGSLDFAALATMKAAEAHAALCAHKGIGPWTADIFLLFCLGHPDAWPAGDLALQEAARMALGLRSRPDARKLTKIAERWRPVRGVAARLLWAWYGVMKKSPANPQA